MCCRWTERARRRTRSPALGHSGRTRALTANSSRPQPRPGLFRAAAAQPNAEASGRRSATTPGPKRRVCTDTGLTGLTLDGAATTADSRKSRPGWIPAEATGDGVLPMNGSDEKSVTQGSWKPKAGCIRSAQHLWALDGRFSGRPRPAAGQVDAAFVAERWTAGFPVDPGRAAAQMDAATALAPRLHCALHRALMPAMTRDQPLTAPPVMPRTK